MDSDVLAFAQVALIIVFLIASLSTVGVLTARAIMRMRRHSATVSSPPDDRLEQLQQSVDAIAVEVERIAEAQRFSAKLLAERHESPTVPR